jgi:RNA-directed DNA polymerase
MEGKSQKRQVKSLEAIRGETEQNSEGSINCVNHQTSGKERSVNNQSWLMDWLVSKGNMDEAYKKVVSNKGAPGVDGVTTVELKDYLFKHWETTKQQLIEGKYQPQPVRRVEIPKPNGGVRKLGIPSVIDRLIQQAINQTISRLFEPTFSEYSYGFRPQRSAAMAITQAKEYIREGRRVVIDMDLEKFFDKVSHDILMERIRRKIAEPRILTLIRRYLKSGIMEDGLVKASNEGTPQGGPLSPLLSNIMLDDLDKELERRGHKFCRYADDCNIYVKSEKAGERVFESITKFIEKKLKLKVNRDKSAVSKPWIRKFLGFSFTSRKKTTIRVHEKSRENIRNKVRELCQIGRGMNMKMFIKKKLNPVIRGWGNYFRHADSVTYAKDLDVWIRKRLRNIMWRQWGRSRVRYRKLKAAGVAKDKCYMMANSNKGPQRMSKFHDYRKAYPPEYFKEMGLVSLFQLAKMG